MEKRVTYGWIVVSIRPNKTDTNRVNIVFWVDKLPYEEPTATQFAILMIPNILLNSLVSTILAMFMCADIHVFHYNNPMIYFEYMKPPLSMLPQEIVHHYNLKDIVAADG